MLPVRNSEFVTFWAFMGVSNQTMNSEALLGYRLQYCCSNFLLEQPQDTLISSHVTVHCSTNRSV
jgi:hypothetical protein